MIHDLIIILNLVILESLLSVDNAAVLAIMVKDLPDSQKPKALKYGLLGAYFFRGLCLLLATYLMKVIWLKILGGIYLMWLFISHFTSKNDSIEEASDRKDSKIFGFANKYLGLSAFWSTVILVEIMDLAFSIDNVFAAVALSSKFWVVMVGVAIGILAMRFVAQWFVIQLKKHPSLETSAFVVIGLLGLKLIVSGAVEYIPSAVAFNNTLKSHTFDLVFSLLLMVIFFIPLIRKKK